MATVAEVCAHHSVIPRVSARDLAADVFHTEYFQKSRPVVICDATDDWPARRWTVQSLVERVGQNEVWIRGKTHKQDYRQGKAYTIRKDTFGNYCADLLKANARAKSSYLAVASMPTVFPQIADEVPLPSYVTANGGRLHLGPYMWVALKGHYEVGRSEFHILPLTCSKWEREWDTRSIQSGAAYHSQGFEDKNLSSSPTLLGQ